jgi:hypothetical protein
MDVDLVAEETIIVGQPVVVEGPSQNAPFGVVFEDEGTTGYHYAVDFTRGDNSILDAMHIYNAAQVTDRQVPSLVQIIWSRDGLKSALMINKYPHAVFDFEACRGYCRTGFPPRCHGWTEFDHTWDDNALDLFL